MPKQFHWNKRVVIQFISNPGPFSRNPTVQADDDTTPSIMRVAWKRETRAPAIFSILRVARLVCFPRCNLSNVSRTNKRGVNSLGTKQQLSHDIIGPFNWPRICLILITLNIYTFRFFSLFFSLTLRSEILGQVLYLYNENNTIHVN